MPRAATTSDAFNAVAEPCRRRILSLLKEGELASGEVAARLGLRQPAASKHLGVLHDVGLVRLRRDGRRRIYSLDARGLRPIHEWAGGFEQFWDESFERLSRYVAELREEDR